MTPEKWATEEMEMQITLKCQKKSDHPQNKT